GEGKTTTETEVTEETVTEESVSNETAEEDSSENNGENSSEGKISNEEAPEEGIVSEDKTTTETEVTEEAVTEEPVSNETAGEDNSKDPSESEISDEEMVEGEIVSEDGTTSEEEVGQEGEEDNTETVGDEEAKEEVIEVASELVPEDETTEEGPVVEEVTEVKIDISFSTDENGYIPAGRVTTFSASIEGIDPFQYFWDFGDGSSSSSQSPQYAYVSDGNYTLSLTIIGSNGNAYSKSTTVHVSDYNPDTTEYWISSDATDEGTGTIDDPYTIDAALSHTVNGDTLYFLPGTYNTSVNLDVIGTGTEGVSIETETEAEELPDETEGEGILAETKEEDKEDLSIKFIAYDDVIFDGESALDSAFYFNSNLSYLGFYNFTFINYLGSAIYINNEDVTNIDIVDNTFFNNGAAIDVTMDSGLNIQNNIIVDNDAGVVISADDVNIEHNVIAFNEEGIVVDDTKDNITVDYNDVYGNEKDYQGVEPGENDISIDPEFADKDNLDFTILEDSPLYENNIIWKTTTNKDDYTYGEQVVITGKGYSPDQELIIRILRADGTFVDDIHITTDKNGCFTYDGYSVDYIGKNYLIQIINNADGNILEVLSFTDCHVKVYKYGDEDGDGSYDAGEPMLENVGFEIYKKIDGNYVYQDTIYTDSNGYFTYALSYGNWYRIEEIPGNYNGYGGSYSEEFYVGGDITRWIPNCPFDIFIKQTLPIDSSTFKEDPDDGGLTDPVVWHFILNQVAGTTTPGTLTATFQNAGTITVTSSKVNQSTQHFYIGTSADDILLSASATVYSPQCRANLVLSHVCHKSSITLEKKGLDSNDTAGFTLYDSSGAAVGAEKTVTGNGSVSWTGLDWDTYTIKETTTPPG
ncbi:MAG: hypothetical protein DRP74_09380, partial [Candidatus Omnitrophota bacterium]